MDYKKFIVGLIIPIATYGAAVMLDGKVPDATLLAIVGVLTLCGLTLMISSGSEGRLILGVIITFGVIALFLTITNFDDQFTQILTGVAFFGVILMLTATPNFVNLYQLRNLFRGGYKGTVKNLRKEGDLLTFWLDGAGKNGSAIQVEGNIDESVVNEGDMAWVNGSLDGRGIIRTVEVQNLTRSESQKLQERKGESEFSGIVLGGIYELKSKESMLGVKKVELLGFRLQRIDPTGNPLDIIEVEINGDKYKSIVFDRDQVQVKGVWQKSGRLQLKELYNLTSKTTLKFGFFS